MSKIEKALLTILTIGLIIFIIMLFVSKNEYDGSFFHEHWYTYTRIIAYSYLAIFFIMVSVTLFLVNQTKAERRVELGLQESASFEKENRTLIITLFFFSMSYGLRFYYDGYLR